LETLDAPNIIFTRSGTWSVHRDDSVLVDSSVIVLGHTGEHYRCSHRRPAATVIGLARQYLEAHYQERCSLHDLASAVHANPFHLHQLFRSTTGQTPQQYLSSVRLDHAKRALAEGESSVVLPLVFSASPYRPTA
jgi:YesN/AraC family two-component response regulator